MKITKQQLKQLIQEVHGEMLNEWNVSISTEHAQSIASAAVWLHDKVSAIADYLAPAAAAAQSARDTDDAAAADARYKKLKGARDTLKLALTQLDEELKKLDQDMLRRM